LVKLEDLFAHIEDQTDLVVRVDVAAFQRIGAFGSANEEGGVQLEVLNELNRSVAVLPRRVDKLPLRDVLADALAQSRTKQRCTYQIRGSQLVIIPAYLPPVRPGGDPLNPDEDFFLPTTVINEQTYGAVVRVTAEGKPLAEILADLRAQTGANIVFDPRSEVPDKKAVLTVALNDVRLYDALRVIADMANLKLVYAGNIYYLTTPANAKSFQQPAHRPPTPKA
jgi:hypothetical protein